MEIFVIEKTKSVSNTESTAACSSEVKFISELSNVLSLKPTGVSQNIATHAFYTAILFYFRLPVQSKTERGPARLCSINTQGS